MTITELIQKLEEIRKEHGDLRIQGSDGYWDSGYFARNVSVLHVLKNNDCSDWIENYHEESEKGEKVVRL